MKVVASYLINYGTSAVMDKLSSAVISGKGDPIGRNSVLTTDGQTDRQTDGDTSAHVELRFAAKNYRMYI